ncbi:MAG: ribokinase [Tannerella sp.]|jgi:ribokinase|nr:ribokinase [Tannerella sp.]
MNNQNKLLVIGSSNTDMVIYTDHFPQKGETILGKKFLMNPGGKGANQAVAAARLGAEVVFVCKLGSDLFGHQTINNLENEGIDMASIIIDLNNSSGVAQIIVNKDGENCIVVAPGANMSLNAEDIDGIKPLIRDAGMILVQLEIPLATISRILKIAAVYNKKVILNPAPATDLRNELLNGLYMITPNETEAEILTGIKIAGHSSVIQATDILKKKGVENVIITLGEKGAYVASDKYTGLIVVEKVQAIDTTGAGDTFNGALAVSLLDGNDLLKAVSFANKAASISVTRLGAQSAIPYKDELISYEN